MNPQQEYFDSPCSTKHPTRPNSNPRYPHFHQAQFTAGDEEQFESHRNKFILMDDVPDSAISLSVEFPFQIRWRGYQNLMPNDVSNTFRYIFNKFKKGIFVQIKNNSVQVFLPFSKNNFSNEWAERLKCDTTRFGSLMDVIKQSCVMGGYAFNMRYIQQDISKWTGNNGLVRYEHPVGEGDSGVSVIFHMLTELCKSHSVPDMEFFVNRRDFPILRTDRTEAYTSIFGENEPLLSHSYERYAPILSMCSSPRFADIPIPTWEDWARVVEAEHIYFSNVPYTTDVSANPIDIPWEQRIQTAVFRGTSSGLGTTVETNPRLQIAMLSQTKKCDADGILFLDAGITKWNTRPRKSPSTPYFDIIQQYDINLVQPLSYYQQASYRYIVHIDGHSSAFRLSRELSYGSVLLIVRSNYQLWFSHWLEPYVHYIPVKADCSDLFQQLIWCKQNDSECKKIANQARTFWETHLNKQKILEFLQSTLIRIKKNTGTYRYRIPTLMTIQQTEEEEWMMTFKSSYMKHLPIIEISSLSSKLMDFPRCVEKMKALQWMAFQFPNLLCEIPTTDISYNRKSSLGVACINEDNQLLVKTGSNLIHEVFVGMSCINKLLHYIPNYSYTFGIYGDSLYTEYFPKAITFLEYLQNPQQFRFNTYLDLLMQIALILHESQLRCGFVHWDLNPWNIILEQLARPIGIDYFYNNTQYVHIETTLNPIIIDYEKSHCVVDGIHHGIVNPFKFDTIHDILTILLSSMSVILKYQNISKKELSQLFTLSKFFSNTQFTGGKSFITVQELKLFLEKSKKYAEIISTPKYELESKTCADFITFLNANFDISIVFSSSPSMIMHWSSPMRIWDIHEFDSLVKTIPSTMDPYQALSLFNRLVVLKKSEPSAMIDKILIELDELILLVEDIEVDFPNIPDFTEDLFENDEISNDSFIDAFPRNFNDLKFEILFYISQTENSKFYIRKWKNLIQMNSFRFIKNYANAHTQSHFSK